MDHIHSSILLKLITFFSICDNSFVTTSSNNWWAPTQGIWGTRMLTQLTLQKSNKGWMKETGLVAQLTSILHSSLIDNQWIWIFLHKKIFSWDHWLVAIAERSLKKFSFGKWVVWKNQCCFHCRTIWHCVLKLNV